MSMIQQFDHLNQKPFIVTVTVQIQVQRNYFFLDGEIYETIWGDQQRQKSNNMHLYPVFKEKAQNDSSTFCVSI